MSYCRWENTYRDLVDCYNNIENNDEEGTEKRYRDRLIKLCKTIAETYGDDD
jgi:hypothetical protein